MVKYLQHPDTIKGWAGLTLAERAVMLHRQFPENHISKDSIGLLYRKAKIRKKVVVIKKF